MSRLGVLAEGSSLAATFFSRSCSSSPKRSSNALRGISARLDQLDERFKAAQPFVGFFGDIIDDALHLFFPQIASLKQKRLVGLRVSA